MWKTNSCVFSLKCQEEMPRLLVNIDNCTGYFYMYLPQVLIFLSEYQLLRIDFS